MHYRFDRFILDTSKRSLLLDGAPLACDDRLISLLMLLIQAYPAHCDQALLLEKIWPNTVVSNWSIARLISDTRKLFKASGYHQPVIQTLHGRGYRLSHEVAAQLSRETDPEPQAPTAPPSGRRPGLRLLLTALLCVGALAALWPLAGQYLLPPSQPPLIIGEPSEIRGRILWVDDNPNNNESERQYLLQQQLAVYITTTTREALMLLSMYHYDAVITDMGRGQEPLAGLKLAEAMSAAAYDTPVYLYTIMPSKAQQRLALEHGIRGVAVDSESLYLLLQALFPASAQPGPVSTAVPRP